MSEENTPRLGCYARQGGADPDCLLYVWVPHTGTAANPAGGYWVILMPK